MTFRRSAPSRNRTYDGNYRFEHWYCDNQVYFITSRCKDRTPAFASDRAQAIFWNRFEYWTTFYGYVPVVTSLVHNHYHTMGYMKMVRISDR